MANQEHLALLTQGVEQWNKWRWQCQYLRPDLREAYLNGVNLVEADLVGANLSGVDLNGANLSRARLSRVDLSHAYLNNAHLYGAYLNEADINSVHLNGADLSHADLSNANLSGADLSGANMSHAHLNGANLDGANLSNTNLYGAVAWATIFANVDLRETKGLTDIEHTGPSSVALHTVQLPQDGRALHFLRGTGVPDEWIDLYCTQTMYPILYYSCFISYSSQDGVLARRLHADLQDHGVRCWFAPEDMKIGDKIRPRIDKAIHMQDKLLLLLSKHAIESSWVEVESAFDKEIRQKRDVLFPVRLDESVMQTEQDWAKTICQSRHIGDFTHWTDNEEYQRAFERLLRDLKKADMD